jgi:hypothetical protein
LGRFRPDLGDKATKDREFKPLFPTRTTKTLYINTVNSGFLSWQCAARTQEVGSFTYTRSGGRRRTMGA